MLVGVQVSDFMGGFEHLFCIGALYALLLHTGTQYPMGCDLHMHLYSVLDLKIGHVISCLYRKAPSGRNAKFKKNSSFTGPRLENYKKSFRYFENFK